MKIKLYNQDGKIVGDSQLSEEVFNVKVNLDLLHQVVVSQASNRRQGTADVKDRAEVRGGGRKPWRQKGTGRARHGSRRSPIWVGGGVTFGPQKERVYGKTVPAKMRKKALFMVLSEKAKQGELIILDELKLAKPKTKEMAGILNNLQKAAKMKGSILIVTPNKDETVIKSSRNILGIGVEEARNLNALDLMTYRYIVMPKESIEVIEKTFNN